MNIKYSPLVQADVLIIGAGPVGLWQAYYLGLQGLTNIHVVDILDRPGGQCAELYPTKPIFDVPGLPGASGQELTDALLKQLTPFMPIFHYNTQITSLSRVDIAGSSSMDGERFQVESNTGTVFLAKAVVLAAGMGSFVPNKLKVPGADYLETASDNLHYKITDLQRFKDRRVLVLGGGDSALDWTLELKNVASETILSHRSDKFRAHAASLNKLDHARIHGELDVLIGTVTEIQSDNGHPLKVFLKGADGVTRTLFVDDICVFYGLSPNLGPIKDFGLELEKGRVRVDTEKFETSIPGIWTVGDLAYYPGKQKLIASGFHEACLAAFAIAERVTGTKPVFQYTTTSPVMHRRLGVDVDLTS